MAPWLSLNAPMPLVLVQGLNLCSPVCKTRNQNQSKAPMVNSINGTLIHYAPKSFVGYLYAWLLAYLLLYWGCKLEQNLGPDPNFEPKILRFSEP